MKSSYPGTISTITKAFDTGRSASQGSTYPPPTGKLCIGHYMPAGGLRRSMLRPEVALDPCDIYLAAGNRNGEILQGCQRYWIAEAIRYTHREGTIGAQDCHGGAFEMGLNALLEEIEEGDEGEAILSRRGIAALM